MPFLDMFLFGPWVSFSPRYVQATLGRIKCTDKPEETKSQAYQRSEEEEENPEFTVD
jgi:hypothetical protein